MHQSGYLILLTYLVPYWSEVSTLIMSFFLCHFLDSTAFLREIREVSAKFLNSNFDIEAAEFYRKSYKYRSKNWYELGKQIEKQTYFRHLYEIFENTSNVELADLHSSILQDFSLMDVDSMLNFYIYFFAKGNPEFLINLKYFVQVEYSKAISFSMIFLLLVKTLISSFLTRNLFKLFKNKYIMCFSFFFTLIIYFTSEVLRADQGTGQIQQDEIRWAELLPFHPIKNGGSDILFYLIILSLHYSNECRLSKISFFSLKRANKKSLASAGFHALLLHFFRIKYSFWKIGTATNSYSEIFSGYRYALNFVLTLQRNFEQLVVFILFGFLDFFSRIILSLFLLFCRKKEQL